MKKFVSMFFVLVLSISMLVGCGSQIAPAVEEKIVVVEATAEPTPEPTEEPTPEPTEEPAQSSNNEVVESESKQKTSTEDNKNSTKKNKKSFGKSKKTKPPKVTAYGVFRFVITTSSLLSWN